MRSIEAEGSAPGPEEGPINPAGGPASAAGQRTAGNRHYYQEDITPSPTPGEGCNAVEKLGDEHGLAAQND